VGASPQDVNVFVERDEWQNSTFHIGNTVDTVDLIEPQEKGGVHDV
jgi:hypothetical protein